jgi:hypothetical protein
MKNFLWMLCGFCAAAICLLIWAPRRPKPLRLLARRLEPDWPDHRTAA